MKSHLDYLEKVTFKMTTELLSAFWPAINDHLLDLVERLPNQDQWFVYSLINNLKSQANELDSKYETVIKNGFKCFRNGDFEQTPATIENPEPFASDIELVIIDEFEREIAIASVARRAETRFSQSLYELNQRLSILNGGLKVSDNQNPVQPKQFTAALFEIFDYLQLDAKFQSIFCKVFERELFPLLSQLYIDLNNYFVEQGILPHIRYEVNKKPHADSQPAPTLTTQEKSNLPIEPESQPVVGNKNQAANTTKRAGTNEHTPAARGQAFTQWPTGTLVGYSLPAEEVQPLNLTGDVGHQQQMISTIAELQNLPLQKGDCSADYRQASPGMIAAPIMPPLLAGRLINTLNSEQKHYLETGGINHSGVFPALTVQDFKEVSEKINQEVRKDETTTNAEQRVIELVGMIFEFMLDDELLPDAIKSVLSYLHTPYLKIAILAPEFFENPENPARQLINLLTMTGRRWVNEKGQSQFGVYDKIKSIVTDILENFDNDISMFDEILSDMQLFSEKVAKKASMLEKRAQQKALSEERLRSVRKSVYSLVKSFIYKKDLPSPVIELILVLIADYLIFIILRHGDDAQAVTDCQSVIKDIIWSVEPKTDQESVKKLKGKQPILLDQIREMAATISFNPVKTGKLLDLLEDIQNRACANEHVEVANPTERQQLEEKALGDLAREDIDNDTDKSRFSEQEREIIEKLCESELGTWLQFDEIEGKKNQFYKLSWINPRAMRFMLIDSTGNRIVVITGIELARQVIDKKLRILSITEKPFFERALENIVIRLKAIVS